MRKPDKEDFGKFKNDKLRLEAIRLLERRRLWLGLAGCISVTLIFLFSNHQQTDIATGLAAMVRALMR